MSDIDAKLQKARDNAKGYGNLRGAKEIADDKLKIVYALLRDDAPDGSVPDKDAWVKRQPSYEKAVEDKANAFAEWTAAESWMKLLFAEIDKYRTDAATNRYLDDAHR